MFHRIQKNGGEVVQISWCLALIELSKFIDLVPEGPSLPSPVCLWAVFSALEKRRDEIFKSSILTFSILSFFFIQLPFQFSNGAF